MGWDANRPVGSQPFRQGDDAIRENNNYIESALAPWMEFGPGSDDSGRPKADVAAALPGSPKTGYYAMNPGVPAMRYYDGTDTQVMWGVPLGTIIMWSGSVVSVPDGWRMCCPFDAVLAPLGASGSTINGVTVPNLGGRFVAGYDPTDVDYDAIAVAPGGGKTFTVTEDNIVEFTVTSDGPSTAMKDDNPEGVAAGGGETVQDATGANSAHTHDVTIGKTGGSLVELDNRPPFFVLAYLILVGV